MSRRVRRDRDEIVVELEEFEVELLTGLATQLETLLADPDAADPALARLFPRCVPDDDELDAEVRRLVHDDLLRARLDGLQALARVIERAERRRGHHRLALRDDEPALMLGVLNDLRLALAARVGIEKLDRGEVDEHHPAAPTLAVVDHLAWLQEDLLGVLDPPSIG